MRRLDRWINAFIRRVRDTHERVVVGSPSDPLLDRYFVIPRNRFFNVYLHHFCHSDVGGLHDHRMACVSIILQGHYYEERFVSRPVAGRPLPATRKFVLERYRPLFRLPSTPHRVVLEPHAAPVWSLFIGLPRVRNWGFWGEINGAGCWLPHEAHEHSEPKAA